MDKNIKIMEWKPVQSCRRCWRPRGLRWPVAGLLPAPSVPERSLGAGCGCSLCVRWGRGEVGPPSAHGRRAGARAQRARAGGWLEFAGERAVLCAVRAELGDPRGAAICFPAASRPPGRPRGLNALRGRGRRGSGCREPPPPPPLLSGDRGPGRFLVFWPAPRGVADLGPVEKGKGSRAAWEVRGLLGRRGGKNMSAIIKEVCDGSSLANHECFALQHADSSNFYITEKNWGLNSRSGCCPLAFSLNASFLPLEPELQIQLFSD
ncbi:uncharacterized protein [Dipodomys merriami]|uniref:uncharacterized protein n=1 Tax=Dipodomys merriami TaxID=94247 RepID=UPI00384AE05A